MKTIAAAMMLAFSSAYGLTVQELNVPGEGAIASALNDRGQVVGTYLPDFGFVWENGTARSLLGIVPSAINNDGIIVGLGPSTWQPLMLNSHTNVATLIPVPTCGLGNDSALAISNSGYITGRSCNQAFRYKIGSSAEIIGCPFPRGECRGSGNAVNNAGLVGGSFNFNGQDNYYAFFYTHSPFLLNRNARSVGSVNNNGVMAGAGVNGPFIFNGTQFLEFPLPKGLRDGYFRSINDAGVAVGNAWTIATPSETRGIIYQNGVVTMLGEQIISANQINSMGQIAGTAMINGVQKAVLILP